MKKQYVKPTVTVMNLNCEGVLCVSSLHEADTDKIGVSDKEGDGTYY